MSGELAQLQIDHFLLRQSVERIACTDGKRHYVVPVTYVYDGENIISQAKGGMKVNMMRTNPNVWKRTQCLIWPTGKVQFCLVHSVN